MRTKDDFIDIIKENEGLIFKVTQLYSENDEDQKDLYQEIIYQLWKSFESFQGASKMSTWIYRVALNTSITHFKREKKRRKTTLINREILNWAEEQDYLKEERINTLYTQIKSLNLVEKSIVFLYLEGKTYAEIANVIGFTTTNIATRLGRIKQKLKSQIKNK